MAIFEVIVLIFNLYHAHGLRVRCLLNIPNGFHLSIAKFLAKFVAILLLRGPGGRLVSAPVCT